MYWNRFEAFFASLIVAGACGIASGCNTFSSTPEFQGAQTSDAVSDTDDTGTDTGTSDDAGDTGGAADTSDVADVSDTTDLPDGTDADTSDGADDVIEPSGGSWVVPDLATGSFVPTISITGTYATRSSPTEFGVAFVSTAASGDLRGDARFHRIALPDFTASEWTDPSFADAQWDVATGLDGAGRLVFGAVQPCQDDVVARLVHRPDVDLEPVAIRTPCDTEGGPSLRNIAITGGLERFDSAVGDFPDFVWSESGREQLLSTISDDFTPASVASDDQMIARFTTPELDQGFVRASGGRLVMFRNSAGEAFLWDASRRDRDGPAPTSLRRQVSTGGELVWLDEFTYLVITAPQDVITVESTVCAPSTPLECGAFTELGTYSEPQITAFRADAFPGGVVIASLAEDQEGQELVFRVFDVQSSTQSVAWSARDVASQRVRGVDPRAFDVAATMIDGRVFVAAAYIRSEQNTSIVDVRGHTFVGF
jgi:hypothetical protein